LGAVGVQLVVELAAAAEFEQEQAQPPPQQETFVVDDKGEETRVLDGVDPGVDFGEEVANGLHEDGADVQGRPRRRCRWRLWVWTRARLSWVISARSCLSL